MEENAMKCQFCTYSSTCKTRIKVHMREVHFKVRDFKCDICSFAFAQLWRLKKHNRAVHEKIRDFKCDLCPFTSAANYALKSHKQRVHEKIRNFRCDMCSFTSAANFGLKNHKDTVHEKIRNFKCEMCTFASAHNYQLKYHMKAVHEKIKDHQCNQCEYKCASGYGLKRHKKVIHKETMNLKISNVQSGLTASLQEETAVSSSAEHNKPDFEEIKKDIDEHHSLKDEREERKCESCFEFEGQVARLTRDLAASEERISAAEKRFEAERRLRLELEQLLAQRGRTQDARDKGANIKVETEYVIRGEMEGHNTVVTRKYDI